MTQFLIELTYFSVWIELVFWGQTSSDNASDGQSKPLGPLHEVFLVFVASACLHHGEFLATNALI